MMAWIPSHTDLREHPKTRRLARQLGMDVPHVVGHLHCLWWWAMDYAQDGGLSRYDAADIADAAGFAGDAEGFLAALKGSGFIDAEEPAWAESPGPWLHDWPDYGGKYLTKRRNDAERLRHWRDKRSPDSGNATETRFTDVRNTDVAGKSKRREEEEPTPIGVGGADAPAAPLKRAPRKKGERRELTDEQRQTLLRDFADVRGVEWKIDRALNHKASEKWLDVYRGVRDWLRDDRDKQQAGESNGTNNGRSVAAVSGPAYPSADGWSHLETPL